MLKKILLGFLLLLCLPAFADAARYTAVSCGQYGSNANSCDQCFDGGSKYVGDTFTPDDYFLAGNQTKVYWQDENWSRYRVNVLNGNTNWYVSSDLIGYPPGFLWYTAQNGGNAGRKYHLFSANSNSRIYATKTGKGMRLQSVNGDNVSPHLPALKFTFVINYHDFLGSGQQGAKKQHTECVFYKPNYCGDGIRQSSKGEVCDPKDPARVGHGNGGCNTNTCRPINNPVCKSLTVNKTTGKGPTDVVATCTGYKVNTFKIDCGNGQVFTGNGNNGGNQTFARTCNYTTAANYAPRCYINNTITSNSCTKTVKIASIEPSIIVDKRDGNVSDLDGNIGNDTQSVYQGHDARFKIRVTNNGFENLKNITLTDVIETSCATKAGTFVNLSGSNFTNVQNANVAITVGGLGNHSNGIFEIGEWIEYYCSKVNTTSNYTNTVATSGVGVTSGKIVTSSDPTVVKMVIPIPEISVDKRDANAADLDKNIGGNDSQTVGVTNDAVFRITLKNTGNEDLKDIFINDPLADTCASQGVVDLVGKKFTSKAGAVVTVSVFGAGNHSDNLLQVGESFTYTCIKINTQESYTNIVDVIATGVVSGKTDIDNDPTEVVLLTDPRIRIIKEDANSKDIDGIQFNDTQTVLKGGEAVFHMTVRNTGNENLKNLTLTDTQALACGTKAATFVDLVNSNFTNNSDAQVSMIYLASSPGDHTNDIFEVGEEFSYTCIAPNTQSSYINIIEVAGVGILTGKTVTSKDPSVVVVKDKVYDLALRKTLSNTTPGPFSSGSTITFDITVFNQGNIDSGIVEIVDYIPTGLTPKVGANPNWSFSGSEAKLSITNIIAGGSIVRQMTFTIDSNAPNSIINYAEISNDSGDDCDSTADDDNTNDGTPVNDDIGTGCEPGGDEDDHDPETITITETLKPSIKIEKLDANPSLDQDNNDGNDTQTVDKGQKAVFSIRVTNDGTENLNTIVLTDARAPNCAGSVTLPNKLASWISFTTGGTGNKTDAILQPGEWFEYTCEKDNTQSDYTNTAGVTAVGESSNTTVNDSDTSVVDVPGGSGGSTLQCQSATQSGSVVTCKGNSKADSFYLKCGSTVMGPVNSTTLSGQHQATFNCAADTFQCYVYDKPNAPITGNAWRTSSACLVEGGGGGGSPHCGNGIIEISRGEECDFGTGKNGVGTNACTTSCKLKNVASDCERTNTCVLTWPNGGNMTFNLDAKSIIGHLQNPLDRMGSISLTNNSDYDMVYDELCVKRTASDSKSGVYALSSGNASGEYCANIAGDVIFAYETITLSDYSIHPSYTGNKDGISGSNYGDSTLTASVKANGTDYYNAYFAKTADIRIAKPAIVTTGGGTSYVKSTSTADVAKITQGKSGYSDNNNFVGTSVSNTGISSYTQEVTNTGAVEAAVEESEDYKKAIEEVTQTTVTNDSVTGYSHFSLYNGLDNIFIVSGKDISLGALPTITQSTTYIIEGGDLTISADIVTNQNIAFVVKGGDINIRSGVEILDGTYISIPAGGSGGSIISQPSEKKLVVNGSLYGNIDNLVNNRYYISEDANQLGVGTIVAFGSSLFSKPAPLVSQFVGEYLESEKVVK